MKNRKLEYQTLQKPAEDYLRIKNIEYIHLQTRITRLINGRWVTFPVEGNKDFPDLIIFLSPVFFVELKLKGQKLTEGQIKMKKKLEKIGLLYYIIRDMRHFIKLIDKKNRLWRSK
jgi:hypothetical protein